MIFFFLWFFELKVISDQVLLYNSVHDTLLKMPCKFMHMSLKWKKLNYILLNSHISCCEIFGIPFWLT